MLNKKEIRGMMKNLENRDSFILYGYNRRDNGYYSLVTVNVFYYNGNYCFANSEGLFKEDKMTWEGFKNYIENFPVYATKKEAYEAMKEEALKYLD